MKNIITLHFVFVLNSLFPVFANEANSSNGKYIDFENQSLTQFDYILHPQGVSVVEHNRSCDGGKYAAKLTLKGTDDFLWNGNSNLNRTELKIHPKAAKNSITKVSFDFMFPSLFSKAVHEFAYWESDQTYQQIMRFEIAGNHILFKPIGFEPIWQSRSLIPRVWHHLEMIIKWSEQANMGSVDIAFDGTPVVSDYSMRTLLVDEHAFIQLGILRRQSVIEETLFLDNIRVETE